MLKLKNIMFLLIWLFPIQVWSAASIVVSVTAPSTSSAALLGKNIVKSMIFSPCVNYDKTTPVAFGAVTFNPALTPPITTPKGQVVTDSNHIDQLSVKITGSNDDVNKDKIYDYDVYFFFVNLSAKGVLSATPALSDYQFYNFRRYDAGVYGSGRLSGVEIVLLLNSASSASSLPGPPAPLLKAKDFSAPAINDVLLGGDFGIDGYNLPHGTWLAVGILMPEGVAPNLNDPKSWAYWDAVPFILGTPWSTTSSVCN